MVILSDAQWTWDRPLVFVFCVFLWRLGAGGWTITKKKFLLEKFKRKKILQSQTGKKKFKQALKKEVMQIFGFRKIHTQRKLPTQTSTKMKLSVPKWRISLYLLLQFFSKVISVEFSRTQQLSKAYFKRQASHVLNLRLNYEFQQSIFHIGIRLIANVKCKKIWTIVVISEKESWQDEKRQLVRK